MKPIGLIARWNTWKDEGTWSASRGREKSYLRRRFTRPAEADLDEIDAISMRVDSGEVFALVKSVPV